MLCPLTLRLLPFVVIVLCCRMPFTSMNASTATPSMYAPVASACVSPSINVVPEVPPRIIPPRNTDTPLFDWLSPSPPVPRTSRIPVPVISTVPRTYIPSKNPEVGFDTRFACSIKLPFWVVTFAELSTTMLRRVLTLSEFASVRLVLPLNVTVPAPGSSSSTKMPSV